MKITVITLFPEMLSTVLNTSILKRAQEKEAVTIEVINLREFATDKYGTVDDRPYGGGAGMVLKADVVSRALTSVRSGNSKVVLTTPKGTVYKQFHAENLSKLDHIIIIAGHYEGYDERIREMVDEEYSLGDFIITGGELAAAIIVDSVVRLVPTVLKKETASQEESYSLVDIKMLQEVVGKHSDLEKLIQKGVAAIRLLEYPHYTRPEEFEGKKVPEVLMSGDHKKISEWRLKMSFEETLKRRPDLLGS